MSSRYNDLMKIISWLEGNNKQVMTEDELHRLANVIREEATADADDNMVTHQHIKRGTCYMELGRGLLQTDHPLPDMAEVVVYVDQKETLWIRPVVEFDDPERFRKL